MVISLRRVKFVLIGILIIFIAWLLLSNIMDNKANRPIMGGVLHNNEKPTEDVQQPVFKTNVTDNYSERFQRPSKLPAYKLKYTAKDFMSKEPKYVHPIFQTPEDVIQAYYAILKEAANMSGFYGGCGTIGQAGEPYPYAYDLLSREAKERMSLDQFIQSFAGAGHTTFLKLIPAYHPPTTPANIRYHVIEIEVITGKPVKEEKQPQAPSYFAYYYGLVTTENTPNEGWKIKSIDYVAEDFLCHPYHHWDYEAENLIAVIYKEWYGLIDSIQETVKSDSEIQVYANGKNGQQYRFDFLRLTNGDDVLLHENIWDNGKWKEVNLLKKEHQVYKFSILNPNLVRTSSDRFFVNGATYLVLSKKYE